MLNLSKKIKNKLAAIVAGGAMLSSAGCGTLGTQAVYPIKIQSNPANQDCVVRDARTKETLYLGKTDFVFEAKRGWNTYEVTVNGETKTINPKANSKVNANILNGYFPGLIVDAIFHAGAIPDEKSLYFRFPNHKDYCVPVRGSYKDFVSTN